MLSVTAAYSGDRKGQLLKVTQDTLRSDNGRQVPVRHFSTKKEIYDCLPSSDGQTIYFIIRKYVKSTLSWNANAQILCFDQANNSIRWIRKTKAFDFTIYENRLLANDYLSTSCIAQNDGHSVWVLDGIRLEFYDCKGGYGITSKGNIINLQTGSETSPGKRIPTAEGIQEVISMDDGSTLVSASGLTRLTPEHRIDTCRREQTSYQSTKRIIGNTAVLLVLAGATGAAINNGIAVPYNNPVPNAETRVSGLCSNVLIHGKRIYQAYEDKLVCYDRRLNTVWSNSFEKERAGRSRISISGDTLLLVNMGTGRLGNRICRVGKPDIHLVDASTGRMIQRREVETKGVGIMDVIFHNTSIHLLTEKEELTYSIPLDRISRRIPISAEGMIASGRYAQPEGLYQCSIEQHSCIPLFGGDELDRYVALPDRFVRISDNGSKESAVLPARERCRTLLNLNGIDLLHCADGFSLLNREGRITETFNIKGNGVVEGSNVLIRDENKRSIYLFDAESMCRSPQDGSER